ncbi:MAG: glucosamine-6-phosphate deaminase [Agathobacter sp.]
MIRFICTKDYDDMSRKVANIIGAQIICKPDSVLGLATGSTPIGAYSRLVEGYENGDLDFSKVVSVNLDEYRGLSHDNDQSYYYFMYKHLFSKVNIDIKNTHIPDGMIADADEACKQYDEIIKNIGTIDLQLLGMGHNGHIGFNEPGDAFAKRTNCVKLAQSTIDANARFFRSREEVPTQAYTMGVGTIMNAKKILVAVSGEDKAAIVEKAFFGDITPQVPASVLQLHPNVIVVGDEAAFSKIKDRL